jgi:phosphoglycerate kinase
MELAKLQDIELSGKNVIVRVDYNVPVKGGKVTDEGRIKATEKTVKYLIEKGCRIVLMSHLGRPKGKTTPELSLKPLVPVIEQIMETRVHFASDCVGEEAKKTVSGTGRGEITLLENLRFHNEEEKNEENFAKELASYGEIFVEDAFGAVHRAHASTVAITKFLPGCVGFLVQKELEFLDHAVSNPKRPFLAITGGAKVSDKILVLNSLLDRIDMLLVGGAMAYTFLRAQSISTGNSLVEEDKIEDARKIIAKAYVKRVECFLPADHMIAREVKPDAEIAVTPAMSIPDNWVGVDIGPRTQAIFENAIKKAKTVFWNGPMGIFETPSFAKGSILVATTLARATQEGAVTIIGGGDTLAVLKKAGISPDQISHCSTGGGASLEFLEGRELAGLSALSKDKQ